MTSIPQAATVLLLRECDAGLQVLLTKRAASLSFMGGLWVFPGGRMEPSDLSPELAARADQASIAGAGEVGMAITASTLTTIAVFFPMIFASGITGKMTQALGLSITFSLLASLFVALTVVPLSTSLLFRSKKSLRSICLLYTSPSPRDGLLSRMPSSA